MLGSIKGVAVGTVIKLILGILVASAFISITTIGALGDSLEDSFSRITGQTDFTAEITNKKQLSHLSMFVRTRAESCEWVRDRNQEGRKPNKYNGDHERIEGDGYPGLSKFEHLDNGKPKCVGGEASPLRETLNVDKQKDFMPGVLSRERFEIKEPINLRSVYEAEDSSDWVDRELQAISGIGPDEIVYNNPHTSNTGLIAYDGDEQGGYVLFFENRSLADERANKLLQNPETTTGSTDRDFQDHIWYAGGSKESVMDVNWVISTTWTAQLCPGDEGYIQRNTAVPHNTGVRSTRDNKYYMMMVITDSNQISCGTNEIYEIGEEDITISFDEPNKFSFEIANLEPNGKEPESGTAVFEAEGEKITFGNDNNPVQNPETTEITRDNQNNDILCSESAEFYIGSNLAPISNKVEVNMTEKLPQACTYPNEEDIVITGPTRIESSIIPGAKVFVSMRGFGRGKAVLDQDKNYEGNDNEEIIGNKGTISVVTLQDSFQVGSTNKQKVCNSKYIYVVDSEGEKISNTFNIREGIGNENIATLYPSVC